jgi:phosphoribosylamine---glycine ligase
MKVLVVGAGGREHALGWKLSQSPKVEKLYFAPGNGGTALVGENVPIKDSDLEGILAFVREKGVELVVAGPELPLVLGLKDACGKAGVACFGPSAYCAQLEGSKVFAKEVMRQAKVPTADYAVFEDFQAAKAYVESAGYPLVVKADGLAAGKGVTVCRSKAEAVQALTDAMVSRIFGDAGDKAVIEEALIGEEASYLAFCDGKTYVPMTVCQDHKAVGDGDTGPNTGGMGAYCPAPVLPESEYARIGDMVIQPIMDVLAERGHPFTGVLYAGLMMTADGPKVLEYNVRFGDPECQPLLARLESDLTDVMSACNDGGLANLDLKWTPKSAVCVVMAAGGYPGEYAKGKAISGIDEAEKLPGLTVFQAGTARANGETVTSGGRVLGVTALGDDLALAKKRAYEGVAKLHFEDCYYRRDIGDKGLKRTGK